MNSAPTTAAALETYSLDLHYIKGLFLHKQYRRCIAKCRGLLLLREDLLPLQQTFVQFYLALAHDQLARAMHPLSQGKIPAFSQADRLYKEALEGLAGVVEVVEAEVQADEEGDEEDDDDPFVERGGSSRYASSTTLGVAGGNTSALQYARSRQVSPRIRSDSLPTNSSADVAESTASEREDLESHESFNEIVTPTRVPSKLERDYSSMSLLECQPQQLLQAVSRGSSRGELTTSYLAPPRPLYPAFSHEPSNWSKQHVGLPVQKRFRPPIDRKSSAEYPAPPVSPLGSDTVASDASTISSMSPDTPTLQLNPDMPDQPNKKSVYTRHTLDHLKAIRTQLETHIRLLEEAVQRAFSDQFERAAAIPAPSKGGGFLEFMDAEYVDQRIQQSQSFWSLVPEDVKKGEKRKRIEAGRKRGWVRERFDARRYVMLAESAMAEL